MYKDIECPYCGHWQDIDHDDGYGYEEGRTYNQECGKCGLTFIYYTSMHFSYEPQKAPCLNGEPHDFQQIVGAPREHFIGRFACSGCGKKERRDEEGRRRALAELYKKIDG